MTVFFDSSALVKRYIGEHDSERIERLVADATPALAARHAFVEVWRAIGGAGGSAETLRRFRAHWDEFAIVELDQPLVELAARLALERRLRTLDALHLAGAVTARTPHLVFATYDLKLWRAAGSLGFELFPASEAELVPPLA